MQNNHWDETVTWFYIEGCVEFFLTLKNAVRWFQQSTHSHHNVWKLQKKSHWKYCQRCKLRSHYEWTKVYWKCQKWFILASFWKPEVCGQTVFTDRSFLIGHKLVESAKIETFKCNILDDFQTLCSLLKIFLLCLNI